MSRPIAVHFGAGNIGRGFIGPLLSKTHTVIFADVQEEIIDAINLDREYVVHILCGDSREETISNVNAVATDGPEIIQSLLQAEIITTSVGPNILPKIAPTIAKALMERAKADKGVINVIACENLPGATINLKRFTEEALNDDKDCLAYIDKNVGFANCTVDRIVPPMNGDTVLEVAVEEFYEWIVDRKALKDPFPRIEGMKLVDNLDAYVERKLYTLNTAHAFLAYMGFIKGFRTIKESLDDPELRSAVEAAMKESGDALVKKHGLNPDSHSRYIKKIIGRFENPELDDDVLRVGRAPLRKLRNDDRLVGPLNMARKYDLPRKNLIRGTAACLLFDNPEDEEAVKLQEKIKELGVEGAIVEITGLNKDSEDCRAISQAYKKLKGESETRLKN